MPRYRLTIEYDGRPYRGFQAQADLPSVQASLERAIHAFSGETLRINAAGRTDTGVHATGQVVHLDLERDWPAATVMNALNAHLVEEPIAVLEAWLKKQPPWIALLAFATPSVLILPIKFSAIFFAAHHRFFLAIAAVVIGKILATAIVARLYVVLRPTLMTIGWFARADTWFFYWRDRAYAFVRALPAWQAARAAIDRMRLRLMELVSALFAR